MFVGDILKDMDTDPLPVRKRFVQMELEMTLAMFRAASPSWRAPIPRRACTSSRDSACTRS